jgi:hypothetical protein
LKLFSLRDSFNYLLNFLLFLLNWVLDLLDSYLILFFWNIGFMKFVLICTALTYFTIILLIKILKSVLFVVHMELKMRQNGSSLFKIDNDSITFFYFFSVRSRYWYSINTVSVRYRYDSVSIPTCQIIVIDIVIDSITLKMYEKIFTFTLSKCYPYIADNVWKKVHFYVIESLLISLSIRYW